MTTHKNIFGRLLRIGAVFLVAGHSFFTLALPQSVKAYSGAGAGTAQNPYRITTCAELQSISDDLSASYALSNDIDCSGSATWNSGAGFAPIASFSGSLDGRNFTIDGLTTQRSGASGGLFSSTSNATLKNIKFTNLSATFTSGSIQGGLIGTMNGGTLDHVAVSGTVVGTGSVAGVVSAVNSASINATSFTGNVTNSGAWTAGLVAQLGNSEITNSFVNGTVRGGNSGGGLVGSAYSTTEPTGISNSYTTGTYWDDNYKSAFLGFSATYSGTNSVTLANNFTTMRPTGDGTNPSGNALLARDDSASGVAVTLTNNYFDATRVGSSTYCVSATLVSGCTAVNTDGNADHYFWGSLSAGPLGSWDFVNTWNTYDNLPYLRDGALSSIDSLAAPSAPRNLVATPTVNGSALNWDLPENNGGSPITGWSVQYRVHGDTDWTNLTNNLTGSNQGLGIGGGPMAVGVHMDFRVAAKNSIGTGDYIEVLDVLIGDVPMAPQNFTAINNITSLGGTWEAPAYEGSTPVDHYQFAYSAAGQNSWSSYDVNGLSAGINGVQSGNYDVRVRAVNQNGASEWSYVYSFYVGLEDLTISTCEELQGMQDLPTANYTLSNDIDCAETETWNDGEGFIPIEDFSGSIDGNNHTISNLHINRDQWGQALIKYTNEEANVTISNLTISNANITALGEGSVLLAYPYRTEVSNVHIVDGSVTGDYTNGGMFAYAEAYSDDVISVSDSSVDVTLQGKDYVAGNNRGG